MLSIITLLACAPELPMPSDCAADGTCPDTTCPDLPPGVDQPSWYSDQDGDGVGAGEVVSHDCEPPLGTSSIAGDCDDGRADIFPGAAERCDGLDDDCDGQVDEMPDDGLRWYQDSDGDGFGDAGYSILACIAPTDMVDNDADCNDDDAAVSPAAAELCDGVDNDCDGLIDDEDPDSEQLRWYQDNDDDGYGDQERLQLSCERPSGYRARFGDCDDTNQDTHPDATELCDATDNDCDGELDEELACGPDCTDWQFEPGRAYQVCDGNLPMLTAEAACQDMGYQLASLEEATERQWFHDNVRLDPSGAWWLGLVLDSSNHWTWSDGTAYTGATWYRPFVNPHEPPYSYGAVGVEQPGSPYANFTWSALPLHSPLIIGYICESP